MKTLAYATAGLVLMIGTVPAFADDGERGYGPGRGGGMMMLHMFDMDMDRRITEEEFLGPQGQRFANADKNGDGQLDAAEVDAILQARVDEMRSRFLERLDGDGNGTISREEFDQPAKERFGYLDRDDNGHLDRQDMRGRHRGEGRGYHHGRSGKRHERGEGRHYRRHRGGSSDSDAN